MKDTLAKKIYYGERISQKEALSLFDWDLIELGLAADFRRKLIDPENRVAFIIDRIINYTNLCEAKCDFCAFHARGNVINKFTLSLDDILQKTGELHEIGGSQVMLQGGLHPEYKIDYYEEMISEVKKAFPEIKIHSLSPSELVHISGKSGLTVEETIERLLNAGLDSVPGASDLLVDRIRKTVSPKKIDTATWLSTMETMSKYNIKSSATMTYGMGETLAERVEHLMVVRNLQDETGMIRAFIPWSFSPKMTKLDHITQATGVDYLKTVAVSRIVLDNVKYFQAGWLTEGMKIAQVSLSMGVNDMGGVLMEETVVKATGITENTNAAEMIETIRDTGKIPVRRDSSYTEIERYA